MSAGWRSHFSGSPPWLGSAVGDTLKLVKDMKCVVTGGAGFIGSNLVDRLLTEGASVTVLDDFSSGNAKNLADAKNAHGARFKIVTGSINDPSCVEEALTGANYIFHLAAMPSVQQSIAEPAKARKINVDG